MILIMGPTGAGKSSQAAELERQHPKIVWIGLGEVLRQSQDPVLQEVLRKGELASDELVTQIITDAVAPLSSSQEPILDGFPRRLSQVEQLEKLLSRLGRQIRKVIYLKVNRQTAIKRLSKRGRTDDIELAINRRWQVFEDETMPVIEYYRSRNLVVEVDANGSVNEVNQRLEKVLANAPKN